MIRKYLTLLLVATSGWLLATPVIHAATGPAITDQDAVHYLNPDQVKQWNDAAAKIKDGLAKIAKGTDMGKEVAGLGLAASDVTKDHADGLVLIKDGNTLKNAGTKAQSDLRKIAIANRNSAKADALATAAVSFTASTGQWPEAVDALSGDLLASLSKQNYKRVYLANVYALEDGKYTAKPDLTAQVRKALVQLDKDKIFAVKDTTIFKLGQDAGKLIISYPDRAANQQGNVKAAVIVGEILFESHSGYATVSLRAVDLSNLHDVANQVSMLSVEPILGKMLGLADFRVPSMRILPPPATANKKAEPDEAPALTVGLQDADDFLGKEGKQTAHVFGVTSTGQAESLENRFAVLMLKSYFLDKHANLKISDVDFLLQALPLEKPEDASAKPADVTGVWVLPNVDALADTLEIKSLKARDLAGNAEVTVGPVSIHRDLPKLSLPSIDDLKAGGYTK